VVDTSARPLDTRADITLQSGKRVVLDTSADASPWFQVEAAVRLGAEVEMERRHERKRRR
jgi:hypothetical protein